MLLLFPVLDILIPSPLHSFIFPISGSKPSELECPPHKGPSLLHVPHHGHTPTSHHLLTMVPVGGRTSVGRLRPDPPSVVNTVLSFSGPPVLYSPFQSPLSLLTSGLFTPLPVLHRTLFANKPFHY